MTDPAEPAPDAFVREGPWKVVDDARSLLAGSYSIGPGNLTTTLVVGFGDDELLVVSPGADPDEGRLARLESRGRVTAILAPNAYHRAGLASWAAHFPDATVHASTGALARVRAKVAGAQDLSDLAPRLGPELGLLTMPDMRSGEVWLSIRGPAPALYSGDTFANLRRDGLLSGLLLAVFGLGEGLGRNAWQRRVMTRNRASYDAWLRQTLDREAPETLIPGHGGIVRTDDLLDRLRALLP